MPPSIPKTQKAAIVPEQGASIILKDDHPVKQQSDLAPGECLVKLECTGVCHTDLHAALGDWPLKGTTPLIGGHEGVGEIVAIGAHTESSPVKLGDRVGIKWLAYSYVSLNWCSRNLILHSLDCRCLDCEQCRKGREQSVFPSLGRRFSPLLTAYTP